MTPSEKNVVKSLVAVAWADGRLARPESGVIEGLLSAFGASDEEEHELMEYARERRTLADIPLAELSGSDRELLLTNAALLTHVDGEQTDQERQVLSRLIGLLGVDPRDAARLLDAVAAR
jgi:tellurite resistance protein